MNRPGPAGPARLAPFPIAPALLLSAVASLSVVAALLSGCAGNAARYDRPLLSGELDSRTGHTIGPGGKPGEVAIPAGVSVADGVSEDEAVAIALWNNAAFQEAVAGLGFDRADLIQAGLLTNPSFYILFPVGPKQLEFTLKLPLEALWLMPKRVAAAELDCEKAASLLVEGGLDLVRQVKVAWAALAQSRRRVALARESAALLEEIARLEEARLRAGDIGELEVSGARVKALKARTKAATLVREAGRAEERLGALLGYGREAEPLRFQTSPPGSPDDRDSAQLPASAPDLESLLVDAFAARPDLRASELAFEAACERAGIAPWEIINVTAAFDANGSGKEGFESGPGLDVTVPIFDQGQGRRARADASVERAARHCVAVRDGIAAAVTEAHGRFAQGLIALEAWRDGIVPALEETSRRTGKALEGGEASHLEVLQSREQLLEARREQLDLEEELLAAAAELERQVGYRVFGPKAPDRGLADPRPPEMGSAENGLTTMAK